VAYTTHRERYTTDWFVIKLKLITRHIQGDELETKEYKTWETEINEY